jgi:hypothetical protein
MRRRGGKDPDWWFYPLVAAATALALALAYLAVQSIGGS